MMFTSDASDCEAAGEVFPALYLIRVRGCLDSTVWADWFGPLQISVDVDQDETTLWGRVGDQAELYGLLAKLRNLTLPLLLVQRIHSARSEITGAGATQPT